MVISFDCQFDMIYVHLGREAQGGIVYISQVCLRVCLWGLTLITLIEDGRPVPCV